jgi:hypothetical protein
MAWVGFDTKTSLSVIWRSKTVPSLHHANSVTGGILTSHHIPKYSWEYKMLSEIENIELRF